MNQSQPKAIVLLSGGLDSMVAAALAKEAGFAVHALTVDYNQRHRREIEAAGAITEHLQLAKHVTVSVDLRQFGGSALTAEIDVPKDGLGSDIPITYVPARNLIFLSMALAWAEAIGAQDLFIGVNALDYSGYPDCRPEFIASFEQSARLATRIGAEGGQFTIHAPLQHWSKARIALEADRLALDIGLSWSCYDPTVDGRACGHCDSCRLRRKGFQEAGLADPTPYADTKETS